MPRWFSSTALSVLRAGGFELREFQYRGTPTYYVEGGDPQKPTLVVFPGFGDNIFSWALLLLRYRRRFHVFGLDFPGYSGMSRAPADGGPVTFDDQDRVAEIMLTEMAGRADWLIGNSMGGWLAMRLALRHPSRVGHVIAVNPGGVLTDEDDLLRIRGAFAFDSYLGYVRLMKRLWAKVPLYFYPMSLLGFFQSTQTPVFKTLLGTINPSHFLNESLVGLKVPLSVVWGQKDALLEERIGRFIVETVPGSEYHPIPHAGHMPQIETPREFHRILDTIMTGRAHVPRRARP